MTETKQDPKSESNTAAKMVSDLDELAATMATVMLRATTTFNENKELIAPEPKTVAKAAYLYALALREERNKILGNILEALRATERKKSSSENPEEQQTKEI